MDKSGIDIKRFETFDLIDILKDIVVYRNTKDGFYYVSHDTERLRKHCALLQVMNVFVLIFDGCRIRKYVLEH